MPEEPTEYTFSPKLKLIIAHLKAVRALTDYVNGVEMKKDIQGLSNFLRQELTRSVLRPAGWKDMEGSKGVLYSSPMAIDPGNALLTKWEVVDGHPIAVAAEVVWPVPAGYEPYVELRIPEAWEKRQEFLEKIKRFKPPDFEHASDYSVGELTETTSIFKYVPYDRCLGVDGLFDGTRFIDAFRDAMTALVKLEKDVDGVLASLG